MLLEICHEHVLPYFNLIMDIIEIFACILVLVMGAIIFYKITFDYFRG